jgi:hypothetical protein
MLPAWLIQLGTVAALAVGFTLGWVWRGWRDRELAIAELRMLGPALGVGFVLICEA